MAVVTGLKEASPNAPLSAPPKSPAVSVPYSMVESWKKAQEELELAQLKLDALKNNIIALVPEQPGDHEIEVGDHKFVIQHQERWDWDQEKLKTMYEKNEVPPHVTRRFRVDKKAFNNLSPEDKCILEPCLTKKIGMTKVKLETV